MKRIHIVAICYAAVMGMLFSSCAAPEQTVQTQSAAASPVIISSDTSSKPEQTARSATAEPTAAPTIAPEETTSSAPDGKGVVLFTIVLHLEGWKDGANETSFTRHASQLREYADLFEQYGAKMTLESKEIIDGCINWNDNVLLEMQQRGHAVAIHADAGGEKSATVRSIAKTLKEMKQKLAQLGIDATSASGVASRADWVEACKLAGIDTVSCMVAYGLWSLDPTLRPPEFEPYENPSAGHAPYPFLLEERVQPWLMNSGSDWIIPDSQGDILLIPTGLSLNGAVEELNGERVLQSEFEQEDINAWREALPRIIAASDSGKINTFYAVWSFGSAVDLELLEDWLKLIDEYVQAGSIQWSTIPEMAQLYRNSLN